MLHRPQAARVSAALLRVFVCLCGLSALLSTGCGGNSVTSSFVVGPDGGAFDFAGMGTTDQFLLTYPPGSSAVGGTITASESSSTGLGAPPQGPTVSNYYTISPGNTELAGAGTTTPPTVTMIYNPTQAIGSQTVATAPGTVVVCTYQGTGWVPLPTVTTAIGTSPAVKGTLLNSAGGDYGISSSGQYVAVFESTPNPTPSVRSR